MPTHINTNQPIFFGHQDKGFYKSPEDFKFTKYFIFETFKHYDKITIEKNNVVFEIQEGVFIITQLTDIIERLNTLSESETIKFERLRDENQLLAMTTKYREPINSFGNDKLIRWKVGF